jgi:hypothetical protein
MWRLIRIYYPKTIIGMILALIILFTIIYSIKLVMTGTLSINSTEDCKKNINVKKIIYK